MVFPTTDDNNLATLQIEDLRVATPDMEPGRVFNMKFPMNRFMHDKFLEERYWDCYDMVDGRYYRHMSADTFNIFRPPSSHRYRRLKLRERKSFRKGLEDRWNIFHDGFKKGMVYKVLRKVIK